MDTGTTWYATTPPNGCIVPRQLVQVLFSVEGVSAWSKELTLDLNGREEVIVP